VFFQGGIDPSFKWIFDTPEAAVNAILLWWQPHFSNDVHGQKQMVLIIDQGHESELEIKMASGLVDGVHLHGTDPQVDRNLLCPT
jgi:hypothetical protein